MYHFSFEFSSTTIKYAVALVVEMKHFYCFNICDNIKVMCVLVDDTVDGNDNQVEETMEVGDIMMYPFS